MSRSEQTDIHLASLCGPSSRPTAGSWEEHAAAVGWRLASEPPLQPLDVPRLRASPAQDVVLRSADGTRFRVRFARSSIVTGAGIVVAPDVRGLHPYYESLAQRFAESGVHAIAIDYFGRTADLGPRGDDFPYRDHVSRTSPEAIQQDLRAASAHLRQEAGAQRVFVVGFCFGGRVAFNAAAQQDDLAGVVGFYGPPVPRDPQDADAPVLKVRRMRAPVLGLFGGADQGIPATAVEAFDAALAEAGVSRHLVTYPGAPHSFFDRRFAEHAAVCDDAWHRMLAFIRTGDPAATGR